MMEELPLYEKRGYLNEEWHLFSIRSSGLEKIDYHYHEFNKIVFIRDGEIGYSVEGHVFDIKKNDAMIVMAGDIHRPEVLKNCIYDRVVLYISPDFVKRMSDDDCRLDTCFTESRGRNAVRLTGINLEETVKTLNELEICSYDDRFGTSVLGRSLVCKLLVILTRAMTERDNAVNGRPKDKKTAEIIEYINSDLSRKMTVDSIADFFYISKYHMMRRFKEETGTTVHKYITEKRLMAARSEIMEGESAQNACAKYGFGDYSSFLRAYKKLFGESPIKNNR